MTHRHTHPRSAAEATTPVLPGMPVLSAGKHASPREGGCFMEMVSLLAGQPWSDHPPTADPTLAALARLVNDSAVRPGGSWRR